MKRSPPPPPPCSPSSPSSSSSNSSNSTPCKGGSVPKATKAKPKSSKKATSQNAKRSSIYRGVTRHRWTGRFEAHLWDKNCFNSTQNKKGRQVYLGAYDSEEAAARAHDLAALKYWGADTILNFPLEAYEKEVEEMQGVSKEEYLASLRRRSSGFSRGVSKYRGVARPTTRTTHLFGSFPRLWAHNANDASILPRHAIVSRPTMGDATWGGSSPENAPSRVPLFPPSALRAT